MTTDQDVANAAIAELLVRVQKLEQQLDALRIRAEWVATRAVELTSLTVDCANDHRNLERLAARVFQLEHPEYQVEVPEPRYIPGPYQGPNPSTAGWRVGRKVGRTIYQMVGDVPSDEDLLIGVMDTPELAAHVVKVVNGRR